MDKLLQEVIDWINRTDRRLVIGISGHGAAGKTTFAKKLISQLNNQNINYLNTDPYIVSSTVRKHSLLEYTYQGKKYSSKITACHPSAHHLLSLERDIQMLKDGLDLVTIDTHYLKSELLSSENRINIVEGMCVAFINPDLFDLKIYFYTDDETELLRRTERDVHERGMDLNYVNKSHEQRRIQYKLFMHPYSEQFDIIVKTTTEGSFIEKNILY